MEANPDPDEAHEAYPWEASAVLPQDRAMGLELELIELEHERDEAEHDGDPTAPIDAEISEVLDELDDVATPPPPDGEPHVDIAAPAAAEVADEAD